MPLRNFGYPNLPPAAILKKIKVAFLYEVKRKARDYEFES
jgi:hypothetical protein